MKFLKKSLIGLLVFVILVTGMYSVAKAQSSLDDIKAKLESEGIEVIDYSTEEDNWGSLTNELILILSEDYSGIQDLAEDFKGHYDDVAGMVSFKRGLAISEARKSGLTLASDLEDVELIIDDYKLQIRNKTNEIKSQIESLVPEKMAEDKKAEEAAVELIFNELNFYFSYNKWGAIPFRVVGYLRDYESLQDIVDIFDLSSVSQEVREAGLVDLRNSLENIEGLNSTDRELIENATIILSYAGESQINQISLAIVNAIKNIMGAIAVLWIVIAGTRMIFAQGDENTITEQKRAILWGAIGLVTILIFGRLIDVIYGPAGQIRTTLIRDEGFSDEIYGIISFIKALTGTVAILFIVVSGVRSIAAQGEEDQITHQRKSIVWIVAGLVLIAIDQIIIDNIFVIPTTQQSDRISSGNIVNLINLMGSVLQFILGFVGLITLGILVYGSATMIMNFGNDEMVEKSKKIIKNAIIGIMVILSAYVIVASLVVFN